MKIILEFYIWCNEDYSRVLFTLQCFFHSCFHFYGYRFFLVAGSNPLTNNFWGQSIQDFVPALIESLLVDGRINSPN